MYSWNPSTRALAFVLASTSIVSLLAEFYVPADGATIRLVTLAGFLPAMLLLLALAWRGDESVRRHLTVGVVSGLWASLAYDLFRLPFVVAKVLGASWGLPLFKVFPIFGMLLTGAGAGTLAWQIAGWTYHFCNGATFGIMYLALAGERARTQPWWAVVFALVLEAGMLLSPYTAYFAIQPSARFVVVTLLAHAIFGLVLGAVARRTL